MTGIIDHLETDTIFYLAEHPERLRRLQIKEWGDVVAWAQRTYGLDVLPTDSIMNGVWHMCERASACACVCLQWRT